MFDASAVDLLGLPSLHWVQRNKLPRSAGIYIVLDESDRVRYIGLSKEMKNRWVQHHRIEEFKVLGNFRIAYMEVSDMRLLGDIEIALIEHFNPDLNKTRGGNTGKGDENLVRLSFLIPDDLHAVLVEYCKRNGGTKTGAIVMLLKVLKDEKLLTIVRRSIAVD